MKQQPTSESDIPKIVTVLSVSPFAEDYVSLRAVFNRSKWSLHRSQTLASALPTIRKCEIGVVICERDLSPGTWIDMLEALNLLRVAPPLIVTSRLADDRLWVEALNLGAYDVLAKPFERDEVVRSVSLAWSHWRDQQEVPAEAMTMNAARTAS
jgi:DNA-binding NtrC family response regulator